MLKTRLIPCIVTKGNLVVQSFGFNKYLPIGNIKTAIEFFVNWDVDEIVILDIDASKESRTPNIELVEWASKECFVPLTVGGGISKLSDIQDLLNAGADKVCINSSAIRNPDFITEASSVYGSQCITVSMDVIDVSEGKGALPTYKVYDHHLAEILEKDPQEFSKEMEKMGAGEIFLNSVNRDGNREGYDIALLKKVSDAVSIPVIACGGVGKFSDLPDGVTKGNCQAVSAANIFQHCEHSTIAAKAHLLKAGVPVRLSSNVKYENFEFDNLGRPY